MKIKHLLIGMLAVAAAVACEQNELAEEPKLDVDKEAVSLAAAAGEASFNVTSNQSWVATPDADWVSLEPASGEASEEAVKVTVTADDNPAEEARTAKITVKAGELTKTVEVTQAAKDAVVVPELERSEWALVGTFGESNNWNPSSELFLSVLDEEYFVYYGLEVVSDTEFKFLKGGVWPPAGQEVGGNGLAEPNTIQPAGGSNIKVAVAGTYDVYLASDLTKFYVMSAGKLPSEATEPAPVENQWSMMGCFVDNQWASDVPMTKDGEWIVAKGAQFTELTFKIRANASWSDATNIGFAPGTEKGLVNAELSVVTAEYSKANCGGDAADIKLNGEPGTYDVYFSFENLKVYVMEAGYKPGEREPIQAEPKEPSYTLAGTIAGTDADRKANYWKTDVEAGLMTLEGDYYVLKGVDLRYDYTFSDDGQSGEEFVKFKIAETGTWDCYGLAEHSVYKPNTEIPVVPVSNGGDIYLDMSGVYDVYFDKANGKVWVMEPGYKPGEEPLRVDGAQWLADLGGGMQVLCDIGLMEEETLIMAVPAEDGSGFALYAAGMYEVDAEDATSGVIIFIPLDPATGEEAGDLLEIEYSGLTATSVNIVSPELFESEEPVPFTKVETPYEINMDAVGGGDPQGIIENGQYWIFESVNQVVMAPIAQTAESARPQNGYVKIDGYNVASTAANAFTFTYDAEQTAYTIQDSYGRYLHAGYYNDAPSSYMYASATLPEGDSGYWNITSNGDGTYMILNMDTYYELAYDSGYKNWSLYNANHGKAYPTLIAAENPVEEPVAGPVEATVKEFLDAAEDYTVYKLTGKIANVKNTYYGNFDLVDETGSVYIYGIVDEAGNKVFENLGLKEGDVLTVTGKRASYNGTPQMQNAVYVSHEAADVPAEITEETVIWTGTHDVAGWSGNDDLAWGGYDWSTVKPGYKLKFYVTPNDPSSDWWCLSLRVGDDNWANLNGVPTQYNKPSYSITVDLTQETIDHLVSKGGLVFTGSETTVTKVTLLPADSEVVIWEGSMESQAYSNCTIGTVTDWVNNGVAIGDKVRIYLTGGDNWAMQLCDPQWNKWYATASDGTQEGLYGQGFNVYNTSLDKGYVEFEVVAEMAAAIAGYTWGNALIIQGDQITITKISIN